jgi:hypothetical protein
MVPPEIAAGAGAYLALAYGYNEDVVVLIK